jgi:hypothetical protein
VSAPDVQHWFREHGRVNPSGHGYTRSVGWFARVVSRDLGRPVSGAEIRRALHRSAGAVINQDATTNVTKRAGRGRQ